MKKLLIICTVLLALTSCGNGSSNAAGTDTANINTTPTTGNTDATMQQAIPRDSAEHSTDSTGNIHPADTTKK